MKVLIVLLLAIASTCASTEFGHMQAVHPLYQPDALITNGKTASITDIPHQVGLSCASSWCGGSLISTTYVLTAAHCVNRVTVRRINAYLGNATRFGGTKRTATKKIVHASYNSTSKVNDIALVQIPAVTYSTTIKNVALPAIASSYDTYDGYAVMASGWGKTTDTSSAVSALQYVDLTVINNTLCYRKFPTLIKSSHICVSTPDGKSTCLGDSGGPLSTKSGKLLVGVFSFVSGYGCDKGFPAVFARVTSYRQWIKDNSGV